MFHKKNIEVKALSPEKKQELLEQKKVIDEFNQSIQFTQDEIISLENEKKSLEMKISRNKDVIKYLQNRIKKTQDHIDEISMIKVDPNIKLILSSLSPEISDAVQNFLDLLILLNKKFGISVKGQFSLLEDMMKISIPFIKEDLCRLPIQSNTSKCWEAVEFFSECTLTEINRTTIISLRKDQCNQARNKLSEYPDLIESKKRMKLK